MARRRWGWRIAVISPAVIIAGLAGAGLAGAGSALAAGSGGSAPAPCPSPSGLLGGTTSTVCDTLTKGVLPTPLPSILPSPVQSVLATVGSTVGGTVGSLTSPSTAPSAGASSPAPGGGTGSSGSGGKPRSGGGSRQSGSGVSALGPVGGGTADLGVLSSLGVPGWLVRAGLGPLPGGTQPLSFPVVKPGERAIAPSLRPVGRTVSSLWLIFAIGVACLVGVAGGLGRLDSRRRAGGTS
jgi:hypothetical protein